MRITMFVNYADPQIVTFCRQAYECTGRQFVLAVTEAYPQRLLDAGYPDANQEVYALRLYEEADPFGAAEKLIQNSDVLVYAHCPAEYFDRSVKSGKPVFRFSQHIYRNGDLKHISLKMKTSYYLKHTLALRNRPVYLMCIGTYTAQDFSLTDSYKGKMYEFGEFPEVIPFEEENIPAVKSEPFTVLWCNQFIASSHPETFLDLVRRLKDQRIRFQMCGSGELLKTVKETAEKEGLPVEVTEMTSHAEMEDCLRKAEIFVMSSDYNEGWGNTLNKAMNLGCAAVVSTAVGSGKLIRPYDTGLLYEYGNTDALQERVEFLLSHPATLRQIQKNAVKSIREEWNGVLAAERFVALAEALKSGRPSPFETGLCSPVLPVRQEERVALSKQPYRGG